MTEQELRKELRREMRAYIKDGYDQSGTDDVIDWFVPRLTEWFNNRPESPLTLAKGARAGVRQCIQHLQDMAYEMDE